MSISTNQAIVNFNDGNKLYKVKLYKEALEQYQKAIKNDPTFYNAHFCVAKTLIRLKKYNDGLNHFTKFENLIPDENKADYLLALANFLTEGKQPELALKLVESKKTTFKDSQILNYVSILLSNEKAISAIHNILQINSTSIVATEYKQLLDNDTFSSTVIHEFSKDNIIPRFHFSQKKIAQLHKVGIQNKELKKKIEGIVELLELIQSKENIDFNSKLNDVEEELLQAQHIIFQHGHYLLNAKNISASKKVLSILELSKYEVNKIKELNDKIKAFEKKKTNSLIKKSSVIAGVFLIFVLAIYLGYSAYQKSRDYDKALQSNSINGYTYYLNKYGNDEKIDALREQKIYQKAISTNSAKDFNQLSRLYPNSKFLHKVKITIDGDLNGINCFGIGNENLIIDRPGPEFEIKVPKGAKIGYRINKNGKIPISKYLTVLESQEINEISNNSKELILSEEFLTNAKGWNLFQETKNVYGKTKQKGVKVKNGELQIFHEYRENKFVLSTIYLSNLTKKINFEIETSVTRNNIDNGTFLLFGATKRAFNYVGFNLNGKYLFGYNNWDDSKDSWVKISNGWQRSIAIKTGKYSNNILKVTKINNEISFTVNNQFIGIMPVKRWYGNRIGFGINDRTSSKIKSLKVYHLKNRIGTDFVKDQNYYCLVDELNVRSAGSKKGEIITTIKLAEPVKYLGERGDKKINATFKDIFSPDYYYKVELTNGTIGWVHGGALCGVNAVKIKDERDSINDAIQSDSITLNTIVETNDTLQTTNKLNKIDNIDSYIEIKEQHKKDSQIEDTVLRTESNFNKNNKLNKSSLVSKEDDIPFDFVEKSPLLGNCKGKSNKAIKNCFRQNLTKYLRENANIEKYKSLGLSDGMKEIKYKFIISKTGSPINIKVWADHPIIENDIDSLLAHISDLKPGEHNGNSIGVSYNSVFNIRIGEKPKKIEPIEEPDPKSIVIPSNLTFHMVDRAPVFPGCEGNADASMFSCSTRKISNYILENINYNRLSVVKDQTYSAKVNVAFKVTNTGTIKNSVVNCSSDIEKSIKESIIQEVQRVIKSIPTMQPALYSGVNVETNFDVVINIKF